ncbi:prolyl-tRNA synthetase associated domain-containing protein [Alphaproteobacteria bacterium]|nr:prolyl-tRNA synthetase associated domain-containing protein [Alphaproteobacteria bacterium]
MFFKNDLINKLKKFKIKYEITEHEALYTVQDSKDKRVGLYGAHSKNLFLKNKKNNFFLISCEEHEQINLKKISKSMNLGNASFAKEEYLLSLLGIKPGSVSPFALINDNENVVGFFLEKKLYDSEYVNFHPLINTSTITIQTIQFINFMIENNKKIHIFSSTEGAIIKTYE